MCLKLEVGVEFFGATTPSHPHPFFIISRGSRNVYSLFRRPPQPLNTGNPEFDKPTKRRTNGASNLSAKHDFERITEKGGCSQDGIHLALHQ